MATPDRTNAFLKVLLPVVVFAMILAIGLYTIKLQFHRPERQEQIADLDVGGTIPDITLQKFHGGKTKLSEINKKVALINFWATWCEACMEEMPSIVALRESFKDRGFEVLGINLDENPEAVIGKAVRREKIEFPIFLDPEGAASDLFDVHAIPFTIIVDQHRKILFIRNGGLDWNSQRFRSQLERWLAG